ncbi:hypothetical protein JAAARDRAFT_28963 [Jaapia argillacea MUCL 33604]|uniref:AB hydrolase-1 domain-containing protein n=1 Tax=Jaapia argillacea MUCL 33604 TaxID=933084 RepID=A0A067QK50_9AGAM|nr:hypothetical protein JAAARDRAFT_28963 [Jaapia argillacea MUCL 33604]
MEKGSNLPLHTLPPPSDPPSHERSYSTGLSRWIFRLLGLLQISLILIFASDGQNVLSRGLATLCSRFSSVTGYTTFQTSPDRVAWKSCGEGFEGFQCANITLPLDYHNESDPRTVTISVNRFLATNVTRRQGAVFMNPGGPGGSGTAMVFGRAANYSKVLQGQYDIVGFDPRGINQSTPYLSCFENRLDAEVFGSVFNQFNLDLPANITSDVKKDLGIQITRAMAATSALAAKCLQRVGESMAFFGTEAVVRDIDAMSRLIEGEAARVNFWGFSYGTIIGQYLVKILPPERIGRVMIDGVVNPDVWSDYPTKAFDEGLDDIENVLSSFASACSSAGDACALSHLKPSEILFNIDQMLDYLYYNPTPITDLRTPTIATAANLRGLLFRSMYKIQTWPDLAAHLDQAFRGNFSGIVNATMPHIDGEGALKNDESTYSTQPIFCSDTKPYSLVQTPPSAGDLVEYVLTTLKAYSPRMGDKFFALSLCHLWEGVTPRRSRYEGTFELENDTLDTPALILSNTFDPVTSLASAKRANERLGNNARLVQQVNGWGHCTASQKSFCTAKIISAYMVEGKIPEEKHSLCEVDEKPFVPFKDVDILDAESDGVDFELRKAWVEVTDGWAQDGLLKKGLF